MDNRRPTNGQHHPGHGPGHHHRHDHGHYHQHDHGHHHHGPGHNHELAEHLHSHVHGDSRRREKEELQVLCASFIDGFRDAADKNSYLRLAEVPFQMQGPDGLAMHLVDAEISSNWQIATASPAFGSRELVYLPFPGEMISRRETMNFTYVSLTSRKDVDLRQIIRDKLAKGSSRD
jgi:hypothetical protein